jgi:Domain of unknown function (DUF4381)
MSLSRRLGLGILMLAGGGTLWAQTSAPPVAPASGAPVEDIRDIRGARSRLVQSPEALAAFGVIVLAAAGYAVWRWRRRRSRLPALTPSELALQQLEQARGVMRPATAREFGGVVSDIVRGFIEVQLRLTVTQRTTQEFLQDLMSSSSNPLAQQTPLLAEFLQQSDMIKFAGDSVTLQTLESLLQSARQLVRETAHAAIQHASISST